MLFSLYGNAYLPQFARLLFITKLVLAALRSKGTHLLKRNEVTWVLPALGAHRVQGAEAGAEGLSAPRAAAVSAGDA